MDQFKKHPCTLKDIPQDPRPVLQNKADATHCPQCNAEFGILKHKYHCLGCGKIFCKDHCDEFLYLPDSFQYTDVERVCEKCFKKYNGIDFSRSYDEFGPTDAPSIIWVSGALGSRVVTVELIAALSAYHVVAVDLPGLGARRGETLTPESAIEAVRTAILEHTKQKKALIFGYSMGGHLAMKFSLAYPDLCTGLILGGCVNEWFGPVADLFFGGVNLVYKALPNSIKSQFVTQTAPKGVTKKDLHNLLSTGLNYDTWVECTGLMEEPHEGFYRKAIAAFDGPILFIHGSKDFRTREEVFVKAAKNGTLTVIEGADHLVTIDPRYRDIFSEKVKEFADKVLSSKSTTEPSSVILED